MVRTLLVLKVFTGEQRAPLESWSRLEMHSNIREPILRMGRLAVVLLSSKGYLVLHNKSATSGNQLKLMQQEEKRRCWPSRPETFIVLFQYIHVLRFHA